MYIDNKRRKSEQRLSTSTRLEAALYGIGMHCSGDAFVHAMVVFFRLSLRPLVNLANMHWIIQPTPFLDFSTILAGR